jgi:hypothetical protein
VSGTNGENQIDAPGATPERGHPARRGHTPKVFTSMWDKIQVVTEVMLLGVALWAFVATYEPLRSRAFGRPVGRRVVFVIRVTAALTAGLCLAVLLLDIFR